jgi:hypothetical protein
MTRIARALAAGTASAALLLTLAGCVPAQAPLPSPAASTSVIETTPTPASAQPAVPVSRVPFACADLLDQATVDAVLGFEAPLVRVTDDDTLSTYALDQLGALTCSWLDPADTASTAGALRLVVVPDAPLDAWSESLAWVTPDADTTRFGEASYLHCGASDCDLDMLVNGYWVSLQAYPLGGDVFEPRSVIDLLFAPVVDSVSGASAPQGLWLPPGLATYPAPASCDDLIDPTTVSSLTGIEVEGVEFAGPSSQTLARSAPGPAVGQRDCYWAGVAASVLPGGAWAFDIAVDELGGETASDSGDFRFSRFGEEFDQGEAQSNLIAAQGEDLVLVSTPRSWDSAGFLLEFAREVLD